MCVPLRDQSFVAESTFKASFSMSYRPPCPERTRAGGRLFCCCFLPDSKACPPRCCCSRLVQNLCTSPKCRTSALWICRTSALRANAEPLHFGHIANLLCTLDTSPMEPISRASELRADRHLLLDLENEPLHSKPVHLAHLHLVQWSLFRPFAPKR